MKNLFKPNRHTKFTFLIKEKGKKFRTTEMIIQKSKSRAIDELKRTMGYLPNHVFKVLNSYGKVKCQTEDKTELEITLHEVAVRVPKVLVRNLDPDEIHPVVELTKDWTIFQWVIFFFKKSKFLI